MMWRFASAHNIGDRKEQQDRVGIFHQGANSHLLVVADGMGGHEGGAAAAQTVIDTASRRFCEGIPDDPQLFLQSICFDAHDSILGLRNQYSSSPGSTCVIVMIIGNEAYSAHVGDSRLYQFRGGRLVYQTTDHSVARLISDHEDGSINISEPAVSQNQLYMCLGGSNELAPEFYASKVETGDLLLVCSDGFWAQVDVSERFAAADISNLDNSYADQLVQLAHQEGHGRSDNICLAYAYCQDANRPSLILGFFNRLFGRTK